MSFPSSNSGFHSSAAAVAAGRRPPPPRTLGSAPWQRSDLARFTTTVDDPVTPPSAAAAALPPPLSVSSSPLWGTGSSSSPRPPFQLRCHQTTPIAAGMIDVAHRAALSLNNQGVALLTRQQNDFDVPDAVQLLTDSALVMDIAMRRQRAATLGGRAAVTPAYGQRQQQHNTDDDSAASASSSSSNMMGARGLLAQQLLCEQQQQQQQQQFYVPSQYGQAPFAAARHATATSSPSSGSNNQDDDDNNIIVSRLQRAAAMLYRRQQHQKQQRYRPRQKRVRSVSMAHVHALQRDNALLLDNAAHHSYAVLMEEQLNDEMHLMELQSATILHNLAVAYRCIPDNVYVREANYLTSIAYIACLELVRQTGHAHLEELVFLNTPLVAVFMSVLHDYVRLADAHHLQQTLTTLQHICAELGQNVVVHAMHAATA